MNLEIKDTELYQEFELFVDDVNIGYAEVDLKNKMLSRLNIYPAHQDKGYGTEVVRILTEKYVLNNLWVKSDNDRAIHVYEKNGYKVTKPTMYLMQRLKEE